jgi:hypothetical protein
MAELIILLIIGAGLWRGRGQRWESRRLRLRRVADVAARHRDTLLADGRRRAPGILAQCVEDVRSLFEDLTGVLHPAARTRIREGASSLLERGRRSAPRLSTPGAGLAMAGPTRAMAGSSGTMAGSPGVMAGPPGARVARPVADPRAARGLAQLQRRYLEGSISLEQYIQEAGELPGG